MTAQPVTTLRTRRGEMLKLPRLGLGTAPLGNLYGPVSETDADAALAAAWDLGVRYFDTAPLYGLGLAETRLNRLLRGKPRDTFVLSTKVGRVLHRCATASAPSRAHYFDVPSRAVAFDYSRDGILRSVEQSLERTGLDRIDILLVHDIDHTTHGSVKASDHHIAILRDSGLRALEELRQDGVVTAIGTGLNVTETTVALVTEMELDIALLAGRYTLMEQHPLNELFPLCRHVGTSVIAAGVFNSGLLAGGTHYNYAAACPELTQRASKIGAICQQHGVALKEAALQFPLLHPAVAAVVVGAVTAAEVTENVASLARTAPTTLWRDLKRAGLIETGAPIDAAGG